MPRQRADEPRDRQLLIRLSARQLEVLESVAHLHRVKPNAYAHQLLVDHLAAMVRDPHVMADMENRAAFDAAGVTPTSLSEKRRAT